MGRNSCCAKQKLRKGLWSPEEDEKLYNYITRFGVGCWSSVPKLAGLQRCGKSCRLRWINYLRPDLKRGMFSQEEEDLIINLHEALGNRWAQIAAQLPGRTDNEIKNLWNSSLKKKLIKRGIDPSTHKPFINEARMIKDEEKDDQCMINSVSSMQSTLHPQGLLNSSSSEQSNIPLFFPEFEANLDYHESFYQSSIFLPHCYDHHQNSVQGLTSFDQQGTDYSCGDNASSRMMIKYHVMMNEAKQSTSINTNGNGAMFSWDFDKKVDSMFGFQFSGVQIQERNKQIEEEIIQIDHQKHHMSTQDAEDLISNYPLSQQLITHTTNMNVFNQI